MANNGNGNAPVLDARKMRALAEWADGLREQELTLVVTAEGGFTFRDNDENKVRENDHVLFQVHTDQVVDNRPKPRITLEAAGFPREDIQDEYDAAFWSESAFEKFVVPYYTALRILPPGELEKLRKSFLSKKAIALLHMPPSRGFVATATDDMTHRYKVVPSGRPSQKIALKEYVSALPEINDEAAWEAI